MFLFHSRHLHELYISIQKFQYPIKRGNHLFVFNLFVFNLFVFNICCHPIYFQPPLGKVFGREYRVLKFLYGIELYMQKMSD